LTKKRYRRNIILNIVGRHPMPCGSPDLPRTTSAPGTVYLVGAGPGDPGLLTIRAAEILKIADAIYYDDLVTAEIVAMAAPHAERIAVGKRRGRPGIGQDGINRRLLAAARQGRTVVRLKGGDPFVFGRGGEEREFLRAAGIDVVVVPGVTAALGCAAEAGLPLTYRNEATRLVFVTAHRAEGAESVDWSGLGAAATTVVVYMGRESAAAARQGLIGAGRNAGTSVAVLARGTRTDAKTVVGRLDQLPRLAALSGDGPAVLVIGDAVSHCDAWRAFADAKADHREAAA
jgi:uroporphyrin-III C-methyltransferase / precorrin-2 dehydrogenase / sirohydrochlorin ferrochelatase